MGSGSLSASKACSFLPSERKSASRGSLTKISVGRGTTERVITQPWLVCMPVMWTGWAGAGDGVGFGFGGGVGVGVGVGCGRGGGFGVGVCAGVGVCVGVGGVTTAMTVASGAWVSTTEVGGMGTGSGG